MLYTIYIWFSNELARDHEYYLINKVGAFISGIFPLKHISTLGRHISYLGGKPAKLFLTLARVSKIYGRQSNRKGSNLGGGSKALMILMTQGGVGLKLLKT